MNITESNATSLLIRALHGDPSVNPDDVGAAAMELKARIHSALGASPDVTEHELLANTVLLQVSVGGPEYLASLVEPDPAEPVLDALDESGLLPKDESLVLKRPAKKSAATKRTEAAQRDYDKRVADQTTSEAPVLETV